MTSQLPPLHNLTDREIMILIYQEVKALSSIADKHDTRINTIERFTWVASGASAALGAVVGIVGGYLVHG